MASAYSTLAREGVHCSPYFIQKITGPGGPRDILYKHKSDCTKAIAPDIANQVTSMLQGVVTQPGATGTAANLGGRPVAGKTGTSENSADLWFVGYVPQYSTAVWVGHPGGPVPQPNEFGGTMAAPIWHNYMLDLLRGVPNENFGQAGHIKTKQGNVPDVTGMAQADAEQALQKAGFTSSAQTADDKSPKGTVFKQNPNGGSQAAQGSSVTIYVSTGKAPASQNVAVPDVTGQDEGSAASALQKAGFNVNVDHVDSSKPRGVVVGQNPSGGSKGAKGDTVTISVSTGSTGPKPVPVPNEIGQDVNSATNDLQNAGFKVNVSYKKVPHPSKDGIVLGQSPTGSADKGSTVSLTVGKF
jgi:membrane peptidoglycan carboxypeptidase